MPSGNESEPARHAKRSVSFPPARDDRVLLATRVVSIVVLPFLAIAAVILFAFPTRTGELFAWQIDVALSGYMLASAYIGGLWFFARAATVRRWHRVKHGFPAVAVFAGALLVATLLHLDAFSSNLSFFTWLTLYATTPFIAVWLILAQRGVDPGAPDRFDLEISRPLRLGLAVIGLVALAFGVAVFVAPAWAIDLWAWTLTPLTARATGAVLSLTGVVNVALLWDSRWSSFRILFQAQLISLAAIVVSLIVRRADLLWNRPMTYAFLALVGCALVVYSWFTGRSEALSRQARFRSSSE